MFTVYVYDLVRKIGKSGLNDPFYPPYNIGRFDIYNKDGELILTTGKRKVKKIDSLYLGKPEHTAERSLKRLVGNVRYITATNTKNGYKIIYER